MNADRKKVDPKTLHRFLERRLEIDDSIMEVYRGFVDGPTALIPDFHAARRSGCVAYTWLGMTIVTHPWNGGSPHSRHHSSRWRPMRCSRAPSRTRAPSSARL
jgi:hypothetical protein